MDLPREKHFQNPSCVMSLLEIDANQSSFVIGEKIVWKLSVKCKEYYSDCVLKVFILHNGIPITTMESNQPFCLQIEENHVIFQIDLDGIAPSRYTTKMLLCRRNEYGGVNYLDVLMDCYMFEIVEPEGFHDSQKWNPVYNGYMIGKQIKMIVED